MSNRTLPHVRSESDYDGDQFQPDNHDVQYFTSTENRVRFKEVQLVPKEKKEAVEGDEMQTKGIRPAKGKTKRKDKMVTESTSNRHTPRARALTTLGPSTISVNDDFSNIDPVLLNMDIGS